MIPVRIATALATSLVGGSALFTECQPPEPDDCPATAPEEGCPCVTEGETGCTADGQYHEEAYVCVGGAWTNLAGTPEGDAAFCGGGYYGACYVDPATGAMEVVCAVPGFIGVGHRKAPRSPRARPARALRPTALA